MLREIRKITARALFTLTYSIVIGFMTFIGYLALTGFRCIFESIKLKAFVSANDLQHQNQTAIPVDASFSWESNTECTAALISSFAAWMAVGCAVCIGSVCCCRRPKTLHDPISRNDTDDNWQFVGEAEPRSRPRTYDFGTGFPREDAADSDTGTDKRRKKWPFGWSRQKYTIPSSRGLDDLSSDSERGTNNYYESEDVSNVSKKHSSFSQSY